MNLNITVLCVALLMLLVWTDKLTSKAGVVVMGAIFIHHLLNDKKEGFASDTDIDYEGLSNLASMYEDGTLRVTNLIASNDVHAGRNVDAANNVYFKGTVMKYGTDTRCITNGDTVQLLNKWQDENGQTNKWMRGNYQNVWLTPTNDATQTNWTLSLSS